MANSEDNCSSNEPGGCAKHRPRDRRATEDALIAAALVLFAEKGYENSSTRCIADMAGCSESLIQRYFNGKEGLLLAVLHQRHEDTQQADFLDGPLCSSLAEEARQAFRLGIQSLTLRSESVRIVLSRALVEPAFKGEFNRVSLRSWVKTKIKARLMRYADAGMIAAGVDIEIAAEFMMSLRFQLAFVYRELLLLDGDALDRMTDGLAEMFARAVEAHEACSPSTTAAAP